VDDLAGVGAVKRLPGRHATEVYNTPMRHLTLAALLSVVASLLPMTALANVDGLSVAPSHSDSSNPATKSYFIRTAAPGKSFTDQVKVSNTGTAPVQLFVSAVDGLTAVTSGAVYANRQDPVVKAGTWVTAAVASITVPGRTTTSVDFTVRVPQNASPGDHLAGIAFEDARPATSGDAFQVTTVLRTVVGVLVRVPGAAAFHVSISDASIVPASDRSPLATVTVRLGDDGLLLGKPRLTVELTGPHGYHGVIRDQQLDTLLPGDTIPYSIPWPDGLPAGDYTIHVTAVGPGMEQPVSFETTVRLASALQPNRPPERPVPAANGATAPGFVIAPWVLVSSAVGMLVLLGLFFLVALRVAGRRARKREAHAAPGRFRGRD